MTVAKTKNSDFTDTLALIASAVTITAAAVKVDSMVRHGNPIWSQPTDAKLQRTGYYALATIIPLLTSIATNDSMLRTLSFVASVASIIKATQIRDYQDNKECNGLRREAESLTFSQIIEKHGVENLPYLQIPNLQEKFAGTFAHESFRQIITKYPLRMIQKYQLASAEFLKSKFIEESDSQKLSFINGCNFSEEYELLYPMQTIQKFISIKQRYQTIPNLKWTIEKIGKKYPNRAELLNIKFAEKERNIPSLARSLAQDKAMSKLIGFFQQELNDALKTIHKRYPHRTTELNKKYAERREKIKEEAHQVGQDAIAAFLAAKQQLRAQNRGPQTVNETRSNSGIHEQVGSRNNIDRVPVGHREQWPLHVRLSANETGKIAEQTHLHRLNHQLELEIRQTHLRGINQQNEYDREIANVHRIHRDRLASLKTSEESYFKQEKERLLCELEQEKRDSLPLGRKQQQIFEQEVDTARREYHEDIRDLEDELQQALRS